MLVSFIGDLIVLVFSGADGHDRRGQAPVALSVRGRRASQRNGADKSGIALALYDPAQSR